MMVPPQLRRRACTHVARQFRTNRRQIRVQTRSSFPKCHLTPLNSRRLFRTASLCSQAALPNPNVDSQDPRFEVTELLAEQLPKLLPLFSGVAAARRAGFAPSSQGRTDWCIARAQRRIDGQEDAAESDVTRAAENDASAGHPPSHSWMQVVLRFSDSPALREKYQLFDTGLIRLGMLLEDMDALAADCAYLHCNGAPESPDQSGKKDGDAEPSLTIVTLGVDRVDWPDVFDSLRADTDLYCTVFMTFVGSSSMEVTLDLAAQSGSEQNVWHHGRARFLMVARNKSDYSAARVPPLLPHTVEEQRLFELGLENRKRRFQAGEQSLLVSPPSPEESAYIHQLFLEEAIHPQSERGNSFLKGGFHSVSVPLRKMKRARGADDKEFVSLIPPGCRRVDLKSTRLDNIQIIQMQDRNLHGKAFGGLLMRMAFELAWSNAHILTGVFPKARCIDEVSFLAPVELGSLLHLRSETVFTDPVSKQVYVSVSAVVHAPSTGERQLTNTFFFAFDVTPAPEDACRPFPVVLPRSFKEFLAHLDGRRRSNILLD